MSRLYQSRPRLDDNKWPLDEGQHGAPSISVHQRKLLRRTTALHLFFFYLSVLSREFQEGDVAKRL